MRTRFDLENTVTMGQMFACITMTWSGESSKALMSCEALQVQRDKNDPDTLMPCALWSLDEKWLKEKCGKTTKATPCDECKHCNGANPGACEHTKREVIFDIPPSLDNGTLPFRTMCNCEPEHMDLVLHSKCFVAKQMFSQDPKYKSWDASLPERCMEWRVCISFEKNNLLVAEWQRLSMLRPFGVNDEVAALWRTAVASECDAIAASNSKV